MIQDSLKQNMNAVKNFSSDELLSALGLTRRKGMIEAALPLVGSLAVGILIGGGSRSPDQEDRPRTPPGAQAEGPGPR
jgi:hypothetical protein